MAATMHITLLGSFCLLYDETPVTTIKTNRLQSLLAYLVLHRDAPQHRSHLAYRFWLDSTEAQARTNLRNLLHQLRQALPEANLFLHAEAGALQWRPDAPFTLDVADFESALARAAQAERAADQVTMRDALEQAAGVYQGDLLPACYDDWVLPERERLRQRFIETLDRLIGLLESQRGYQAAIGYAQRLLRHDPLHEAACRRLMRLRALSGDRAGALRVYHTCATTLQRELGVDPSPATREAHERLLKVQALPGSPGMTTPAASPLVGREAEWARLGATWRAAAAGGPRLALLLGEAGIGKTRLAEELVEWADRQGIAHASARCYAAEGELAYAPAAAWLRARPWHQLDDVWLTEVARLLPEVLVERPDLSPPGPLAEAWQRQRLFEALARAILAGGDQPLLLFIDNLQWCDRDTLEWLHYVMRFDPRARLLILGAFRPGGIGEDHPLASLRQALRQDEQLTEIELGRLSRAETASLATNLCGRELDPAYVTLVYRETEGVPLFIVETVRAGSLAQARGRKKTATGAGPSSLPPKVQSVIEARLAQLSPPARELASMAATIGREFTFGVLARASDEPEDSLVCGLDELWQRRIVREQGTEGYDFSHGKLREVAYAGLSAARRRWLHCRVAHALEVCHASDLDAVSHQVAVHYERASLPEQAISYYQRAAEVARRVYANQEAVSYLQRALALIEGSTRDETQDEWREEVCAQVQEGMGDALVLTGQHEEARDAYERALAQIPKGNPLWQVRLYRKTGNIWRDHGQHEEALRAYDLAETALGRRLDEPTLEWRQEWINVQLERMESHYFAARLHEIAEMVEEVQPGVEQYGTSAQRMHFFMCLVQMQLRRDRFVASEETLAYGQACLEAVQESGNLSQMADARFVLGFAQLWHGDLAEADKNLQTSLTLAERIGNVAFQARGLTYLTIAYRKQGRVEETRPYTLRSLEAATAAEMSIYIATAKANLAWVAWRDGNLPQAEENGRAALEMWPPVYPFQWTALWPLIGVALVQDCVSEAFDYARVLLDPLQQRLPDALTGCLEETIRAGEQGQPEAARMQLDRAIQLAQEKRYL
jgi:DNA-binding SARP family transcriptional activator/predicted ATPase